MITPAECLEKYGKPELEHNMIAWNVPADITDVIHAIPKKIYINKDMVFKLAVAFRNVIKRGLADEIKTWDGCFNIRKQRGATSQSLHSWGLAIDINAAWNGLGKKPTMSDGLVKCFTDTGFDWGGVWKRVDGMHFQISMLP